MLLRLSVLLSTWKLWLPWLLDNYAVIYVCLWMYVIALSFFLCYYIKNTLDVYNACKHVHRHCSNYYTAVKASTLFLVHLQVVELTLIYVYLNPLCFQITAELMLQQDWTTHVIFIIISWQVAARNILYLFHCKWLLLPKETLIGFWMKWTNMWTSE